MTSSVLPPYNSHEIHSSALPSTLSDASLGRSVPWGDRWGQDVGRYSNDGFLLMEPWWNHALGGVRVSVLVGGC